ncbi:hypothetical protein I317_07078 [Kwoniella heveanensis CBS 569]|uniref:Uncharacterized protein n=1 Tax=Kwoniella heveanensis BCC8398 TaxID=1296120 RepID=A0A1B9GSF5_9TREE|nr:hypothetical protein I316_04302 [Kwoniella heveanensis BCC8398]OCF39137.1 hypothetical protein I317_07078 [Kwoniella heveanensis CBS 569]
MTSDVPLHTLMDSESVNSAAVLYTVSAGKPGFHRRYGGHTQEVNVYAKPGFEARGSFNHAAFRSMIAQSHRTIRQLDATKCAGLSPEGTVTELSRQLDDAIERGTASEGISGDDQTYHFRSERLQPSEYHERNPRTFPHTNWVREGQLSLNLEATYESCSQDPGLTVFFSKGKYADHSTDLEEKEALLADFEDQARTVQPPPLPRSDLQPSQFRARTSAETGTVSSSVPSVISVYRAGTEDSTRANASEPSGGGGGARGNEGERPANTGLNDEAESKGCCCAVC